MSDLHPPPTTEGQGAGIAGLVIGTIGILLGLLAIVIGGPVIYVALAAGIFALILGIAGKNNQVAKAAAIVACVAIVLGGAGWARAQLDKSVQNSYDQVNQGINNP